MKKQTPAGDGERKRESFFNLDPQSLSAPLVIATIKRTRSFCEGWRTLKVIVKQCPTWETRPEHAALIVRMAQRLARGSND